MKVVDQRGEYTAFYRKSRWYRMMDGLGCVRRREVFCWIVTEEQKIGALEFIEFQSDDLVDNEHFFDAMDADSHTDATLGELLCSTWDEVASDVLCYGAALEFRLAWMSPEHAKSGIWARVAGSLITRELDGYSILIMKAFPLEYEGRGHREIPLPPRSHTGFMHRQQAMVRYYRRLFGVNRFPGAYGKEGWLWRASPRIADLIPKPKAVKRVRTVPAFR